MQFSQVCRHYRILDLKTLAEYCADLDGFAAAGFITGQSYNYSSDRFLSTLGGALFSLLQRIPVCHLYAYFPDEVLVRPSPDTTLLSNKSFFDFLKSDTFISYVSANQDAIMHNMYVKDHWSITEFNYVYEVLFTDITRYANYIDKIYEKVCTVMLTMELHDETILSLYTEIPQLRSGIFNRLNYASHGAFKEQPGIYPDAFLAFKRYMKKVAFDTERNDETVVENYIGYCLQFFICSSFYVFLADYKTPKALVSRGENDEHIYSSDLIKLSIHNPNSTTNLAEVFEEVNALDYAFFARQKLSTTKSMVPYSSVVDFVSDKLLKSEIDTLNNLFRSCTVTKELTLQMVPTYRGDIQLNTDAVDQSFRDRIKQGKRILGDIYDSLKSITPATFEDTYKNLIQSNSRDNYLRKDSNFNIIPTKSIDCEGKTFYSDDSYEVIERVIRVFNSLFKLNHELKSYDTSLSFLWQSFINESPNRTLNIFREHTTVASYLSTVLSRSNPSEDLLADDYGTLEPLSLYVTDTLRKQFLQVLSSSRAIQPDFKSLMTLSNARLHKTVKVSDSSLINKLYASFAQIQLRAFEPDFDSCKGNDVIPMNLCQLIYRDILGVHYSFRKSGIQEDQEDPLIEETLIDYQVFYNFSAAKLSMEEYCLEMSHSIIEQLTAEAWECLRANFSSLCIALLELVPHGELEDPIDFKGDLFVSFMQVSCLPQLTQQETKSLAEYISLAEALLSPSSEYFDIINFKKFAKSITLDSLEAIWNLDSSDLNTVANTFAFRWFFGTFNVLWKYVANADSCSSLTRATSIFCDCKLITETAFMEIQLLSDIGEAYTQYMQPLEEHLNIAKKLPRDTEHCKYTETRALELRNIISVYKSMRAFFFEPLKSCCDCIHSYNATVSGFELLEAYLRDASITTHINYHLAYGYDQDYLELMLNQLCGCICWFISHGSIAQTFTVLNYLAVSEQQVNAFLLSSVALTDSSYIPRVYAPVDMYYTRQTAKLTGAFHTTEYKECLMYNKNTDINIMHGFRELLVSSKIDENGFCYTNAGSYIVAYDVNDTCHFLSKDGVWVGYLYATESPHMMPYAELERGKKYE